MQEIAKTLHFVAYLKEKNKINLPEDRYPATVRETEYDER